MLHDLPALGYPRNRVRWLAFLVVFTGCHRNTPVFEDAYIPLDAPNHQGAGPGGGLLDDLRFAVVGDTRPMNLDDTANYPTAVVQAIWTDVQAEHPLFAVTTGDYMFASPGTPVADAQLDLYLGARAQYSGVVYPALGNHECTGDTASNCADSVTTNFTAFMTRMLGPIGEPKPYFAERFAANDGSWTAKLVFIAANAWDTAQGDWLERVMSEPTTYTFVIRHEPHFSTPAPGVSPSQDILSRHDLTMLITGHTHTYEHLAPYREIIVGNGGAPLASTFNYGYVIIDRAADGTIEETEYDYQTHAVGDHFVVHANGL